MGSSSKPKQTEAEKALNFQNSNLWKNIKETFWPLDEKNAVEAQNVGRGRIAREEAARGATPLSYNPQTPGNLQAQALGLGADSAGRVLGLRNNEQDRLAAGTVNQIATGREIQGQGMSDTTSAAVRAANLGLSRSAAKSAVNTGIINGLSNLAGTAATAYFTRPSNPQAQQQAWQAGGGTFYGP